jgi:hypothetical protein
MACLKEPDPDQNQQTDPDPHQQDVKAQYKAMESRGSHNRASNGAVEGL